MLSERGREKKKKHWNCSSNSAILQLFVLRDESNRIARTSNTSTVIGGPLSTHPVVLVSPDNYYLQRECKNLPSSTDCSSILFHFYLSLSLTWRRASSSIFILDEAVSEEQNPLARAAMATEDRKKQSCAVAYSGWAAVAKLAAGMLLMTAIPAGVRCARLSVNIAAVESLSTWPRTKRVDSRICVPARENSIL